MKVNSAQDATLFRFVRTSAVLLLLGLYALTSLRVTDLHRISHDQEHTVDHSPTEENNPCHQAIYHSVAKACDHEFHITQDKSCSLCDAIVYHSHISESSLTESPSLSPVHDQSSYSLFITESPDYTSSDRGPPVA